MFDPFDKKSPIVFGYVCPALSRLLKGRFFWHPSPIDRYCIPQLWKCDRRQCDGRAVVLCKPESEKLSFRRAVRIEHFKILGSVQTIYFRYLQQKWEKSLSMWKRQGTWAEQGRGVKADIKFELKSCTSLSPSLACFLFLSTSLTSWEQIFQQQTLFVSLSSQQPPPFCTHYIFLLPLAGALQVTVDMLLP